MCIVSVFLELRISFFLDEGQGVPGDKVLPPPGDDTLAPQIFHSSAWTRPNMHGVWLQAPGQRRDEENLDPKGNTLHVAQVRRKTSLQNKVIFSAVVNQHVSIYFRVTILHKCHWLKYC